MASEIKVNTIKDLGGNTIVSSNGSGTFTSNLPSTTLTGSTNNTITTVTGANAIQGEADLTFDGDSLLVKNGASGGSGANANANELVVENSDHGGISILTPYDKTGAIYFGDGSDDNIGMIEYPHDANCLKFTTNASERMRITSGGIVGVGANASSADLGVGVHVKTADSSASALSGADQLVLESNADCGLSILSDTNDYGQVVFGDSGDNDIGKIRYNHGNNSMDVYVNGAEAMRIDQYRNVGIGTTSVNAKFEVVTNIDGVVARFVNDGDDANRDGIYVQGGHDNGSGTTTYFLAADGDGTSTGGLETSSGTFQLFNTSDKRLKQNIVDTSINGINSIKNLKVRDFAYKKNPTETIVGGFIAQELKEVFPQAVSEGRTEEKILSVSRERLVPFLTKALQEAITKIETLEAKVTALENA